MPAAACAGAAASVQAKAMAAPMPRIGIRRRGRRICRIKGGRALVDVMSSLSSQGGDCASGRALARRRRRDAPPGAVQFVRYQARLLPGSQPLSGRRECGLGAFVDHADGNVRCWPATSAQSGICPGVCRLCSGSDCRRIRRRVGSNRSGGRRSSSQPRPVHRGHHHFLRVPGFADTRGQGPVRQATA